MTAEKLKKLKSSLRRLQKFWDGSDYANIRFEILGDENCGTARVVATAPEGAFLFGDYEDIFFEEVAELAEKHGVEVFDTRSFRASSEVFLTWNHARS